MSLVSYELYSQVQDAFGSVASIYFSEANDHTVIYKDFNGVKFFEEVYKKESIEEVENVVIDWAKGNRNLA